MAKKTIGQLFFYCTCPTKTKIINNKILVSLFSVLIGIFLLPNIAYFSDITGQNLIELTNQERIKIGLKPLTANQLLTKAAYQKGNDILATQTFQHNINGQKFSNWIKNTGYKYSYVGENLAIDFVTSKGVVNAWLDSPLHKENLLNSYFSEIGIATIEGKFQGINTIIVVQIFGTPAQSILQPRVMGISDIEQLNLSTANYNQITENLLIHSIASQSLLPADNSSAVINLNNYEQQNRLTLSKKLFENFYYLQLTVYLVIMAFSILLILSICYLYFFFFSRLTKSYHY